MVQWKCWAYTQHNCKCNSTVTEQWPVTSSSQIHVLALEPKSTHVPRELGGGFNYFLFSPPFGEDEPSLTNIFQMGWFNHQPENDIGTWFRTFTIQNFCLNLSAVALLPLLLWTFEFDCRMWQSLRWTCPTGLPKFVVIGFFIKQPGKKLHQHHTSKMNESLS